MSRQSHLVNRFLATLLAIQLSVGIAGCATNPITGRSQIMLVSDNKAARYSAQAYDQLLLNAEKQQVLDEDPATVNRVRSIAQPLIAQAAALRPETRHWQWEVHVLKSDQVNAWCMAGGKIAVYTGLLQKIRPTDDELAQVLGHEIAHALLSHQAEKMSRLQVQKLGLGLGVLAGAIAGYNLGGVAGLADTVATVSLQLPNSRKAESEADAVGIELAAKAGYDPFAAISLWEKMIKVGGSGGPDWLSTHPNPEQRLQSMRVKAQQLMPVYEANRRAP
jgi:predicted Zn-dependent protease